MEKENVFIVCPGLGHINRGYESFTRQCFDTLKDTPEINFTLLKGAGENYESEYSLKCIHRNTKFAKKIGNLLGCDGYVVEQFSFLLSMIPKIIKYKPSLIFFSDFRLGTWLWHLRRITGFKYKLLFSNGAPNGPPFTRTDHVQQLLKFHFDNAVINGADPSIQTVLPYGISLPDFANKRTLKPNVVKLISGRRLIVSAGGLNVSHKRMDYVINEFAKLDHTCYFLYLIGQPDNETKQIQNLASSVLQPNSFLIESLNSQDALDVIYNADCFVLASVTEGFGRVLIEAASAGVPVVSHDYDVSREVLQEFGYYLNMKQNDVLKNFIENYFSATFSTFCKELQIEFVRKKYHWHNLKDRYLKLVGDLIKTE